MNFFALLVLGHLVGDFLLQPKWMAMDKNGNWYTCTIHCLVYTLAVTLFTWPTMAFHLSWPLVVFLTHWPIDYFSLADKWLAVIEGRSLKDFFLNGHKNLKEETPELDMNHRILRGGFTSVVYTVTDNTMHLVLMYLAAVILYL